LEAAVSIPVGTGGPAPWNGACTMPPPGGGAEGWMLSTSIYVAVKHLCAWALEPHTATGAARHPRGSCLGSRCNIQVRLATPAAYTGRINAWTPTDLRNIRPMAHPPLART